jgi:formate-dependent nitrite reductase membrane component NrfD
MTYAERIVASPHWEWWLVFYFFLGGIAAGSYFMAALIELVGTERDRELAKVSYYIAFPLIIICTVLLILDLGRPERFWHMMLQANTLWPMFKYWSPMSVGSWALAIFGGITLLCWPRTPVSAWDGFAIWPRASTAGSSVPAFSCSARRSGSLSPPTPEPC